MEYHGDEGKIVVYELIQVAESTYYIQSPAKIGIVKLNDTDVCLIDSGNDKDAGKKIKKVLDAQGWNLVAIYNTHSHADHIGGNKYLQSQTGCKIYAAGIEAHFAKSPVLEPTSLYGGFPSKDLRHKFLMAQESEVEELTSEKLPEGLEIIPLPGHSFDMVGFRTKDDVVFLADSLSSKETLDKYQISFLYDVESYLQTLEMIKTIRAKKFIPSHAMETDDTTELAQHNIDKVNELAEKIIEFCEEATTFEALLQKLFTEYNLTMTHEQHALVGSTVRSYLSWLKDSGKLITNIENNMLLWQQA